MNKLKPFLAVVIYLMMQMIVSIVLVVFYLVTHSFDAKGMTGYLIQPIPIAVSCIISTFLSVGLISLLKLIRWKEVYSWSKMDDHSLIMPLLASVAGMLGITVFLEVMGFQSPDFTDMARNFWGVLYMVIIGPIGEELCCREAMLGGLLKRGVKPWIAILLSAFIFGALHGNLGQFVAGGLMGVILGIMYYKTGNAVLSTLLHIMNNSLASVLMLTTGDQSFSSMVGGEAIAIAIGLAGSIFCILYFAKYLKKGRVPND